MMISYTLVCSQKCPTAISLDRRLLGSTVIAEIISKARSVCSMSQLNYLMISYTSLCCQKCPTSINRLLSHFVIYMNSTFGWKGSEKVEVGKNCEIREHIG